jgi:hypothetical protein
MDFDAIPWEFMPCGGFSTVFRLSLPFVPCLFLADNPVDKIVGK